MGQDASSVARVPGGGDKFALSGKDPGSTQHRSAVQLRPGKRRFDCAARPSPSAPFYPRRPLRTGLSAPAFLHRALCTGLSAPASPHRPLCTGLSAPASPQSASPQSASPQSVSPLGLPAEAAQRLRAGTFTDCCSAQRRRGLRPARASAALALPHEGRSPSTLLMAGMQREPTSSSWRIWSGDGCGLQSAAPPRPTVETSSPAGEVCGSKRTRPEPLLTVPRPLDLVHGWSHARQYAHRTTLMTTMGPRHWVRHNGF